MRVVVITPPDPVISLKDVDAHLGLSGDLTDQAHLEGFIAAAIGHVDGPSGWLGRAIGPQTLEARFDTFGQGAIRLPYPPCISIESLKLLSRSVETIVDRSSFYCEDEFIVPGQSGWPALPDEWGLPRIRVRYRAGYTKVPAPIKAALLLMVGDMYRFRETVSDGSNTVTAIPMSTKVEDLLMPFRVYR